MVWLRCRLGAAFGVVLVAVMMTVASVATARSSSPEIAARIDAAVRANQAALAAAGTGPNAQSAALQAQRRLESELSAIVVGTIAQRPDLLTSVVQTAVNAAPQARDRIASRAASAS